MERVHFIGIGGAGMAPLAAILLEHGAAVTGSDREANAKTAELARHGAVVHIGQSTPRRFPKAILNGGARRS